MKNSASKQQIFSLLSSLGFLMIAAAMVVPLINGPFYTGTWYHYLYAAGAALMLICQLMSPFKGSDKKLRRLHRLQGWGVIFFCVATFFLFYHGVAMQDWIAFTLAGAIVRAYASWASYARMRKLSETESK